MFKNTIQKITESLEDAAINENQSSEEESTKNDIFQYGEKVWDGYVPSQALKVEPKSSSTTKEIKKYRHHPIRNIYSYEDDDSMNQARTKRRKLTIFPLDMDALNVTETNMAKIFKDNTGYFNKIANNIENLKTLVKRFPKLKNEIRDCALTPAYFDACIFGAKDLYTLVEIFPEQKNIIYDIAMEKGFHYYATNSLDVYSYSESPLELILLAFPEHHDDILKDFNTRLLHNTTFNM